MNTENAIRLPDGRLLSFAEYGDPSGLPVMYFHGAPSSRFEPQLIGDEIFCRYGLRIIAPDRPGMGNSTFQPGRRISDWPADVAALADSLAIDSFSVLGNSGGGPYVTVCAAKLSERLKSAVITSGAWRMDSPEAVQNLKTSNRMMLILAKRAPFLLGILLKSMNASSTKAPSAKSLEQMKQRLPAADYEVLMRPGMQQGFHRMSAEAMRQGTRGVAWDVRLLVTDWGFSLSDVRTPIVIYHGGKDKGIPLALPTKAVTMLLDARLVVCEQDGHVSTPINHLDEIARILKKE